MCKDMRRRTVRWITIALAVGVGSGAAHAVSPPSRPLADSRSPYLREHAADPVHWQRWSSAALAKARKEDKPIFLAIGYSTCHWCHVMDQQTYRNPHIAALINRYFVPILVDREQRPDLDHEMMRFLLSTTGSGGWPMTLFLTPAGQPFAGGTYFPPTAEYGLPGLGTVVKKIHALWARQSKKIVANSKAIETFMKKSSALPLNPAAKLNIVVCRNTFHVLSDQFDKKHGGWGDGAKFPNSPAIDFLLAYYHLTGNQQSLKMVVRTLQAMRRGGIYDQIGGGFHRYTVDADWRHPHFEKMLYDQALNADAYLDAWQIKHRRAFARTITGTLNFVLHTMRSPSGLFYDAVNADSATSFHHASQMTEGAYYLWKYSEITKVLGQSAPEFMFRYGVRRAGNASFSSTPALAHENILYLAATLTATARKFHQVPAVARRVLRVDRHLLLAARQQRPAPALDNKTIAAWNGLMIHALARAGAALNDPAYIAAATKAAAFIQGNMWKPKSGILYRQYSNHKAMIPGFLTDYALTIHGLVALYEATLDIRWLKFAVALQRSQDRLFFDGQNGGYYATPASDLSVLFRWKNQSDNVEPGGNSLSVLNLMRLAEMTGIRTFAYEAKKTIHFYAAALTQYPGTLPEMCRALLMRLTPARQVVIAGKPGTASTRAMLHTVFQMYLPNTIVLGADGGAGQRFLARHRITIRDMHMMAGRATAYVCHDYTCRLPTSSLQALARSLQN